MQRSAAARPPLAHADAADRELGRFSVRARRGLNRLRLSGRLRGRPLPAGRYRLLAQAITPDGQGSGPATVAFRIR